MTWESSSAIYYLRTVHRLYDLPRTAHTRLVNHIVSVPHVYLNLKCSFDKFGYKAINF